MISAVMGDFIGSVFENSNIRTNSLTQLIYPKSCITDESVMVAATCDALVNSLEFSDVYLKWGKRYPDVAWGWGTSFWIEQDDANYMHDSAGNLAASRAIPIGLLDFPLSYLLDLAFESARCSHNSPEGIDGAKAIVYTMWAVRNGKSQNEIYEYLFAEFGYLMNFYTVEQLRQSNEIDCSAINTVPVAIWLAFNSKDWNDSIGLVIHCQGHGDTDSIMCMTSAIASVYHGKIDSELEFETKKWLFKNAQDVLQIVQEFEMQKEICGLPF
jgi:ADP-ribosylglycohydrolase